MKITVLTSSRADYSIYLPLLKELQSDDFFEISLIVFGTHLSNDFGLTLNNIIKDGFVVSTKVNTMPLGDAPFDISLSMGSTIEKFSEVWIKDQSDLIIALGDRFEMFAACMAAFPFGKRIAHIHGGETTLGAIDDALRHSISLVAHIHFVTTNEYAKKVENLRGHNYGIFNVGALSIDNLTHLNLLSIDEFKHQFNIDLSIPSVLITFHPETVAFEKNEQYINEILEALSEVRGYQFIFTMPNADTMGNLVRKKIRDYVTQNTNAIAVESFGTIGYLSCMKHSAFLLGNTSSGFVEASFFPKYVINLGERQSGRILTNNIHQCEIVKDKILSAIHAFQYFNDQQKIEVYGNGTSAKQIKAILKNIPIE